MQPTIAQTTIESHAPLQRVPDLEWIVAAPSMILTLKNGKNPRSIEIMEKLGGTVFNTQDQIQAHLLRESGPFMNAVVLFDEALVNGSFSPLSRIHRRRKDWFPDWTVGIFWGVAIHPKLAPGLVASTANQIWNDFLSPRFMERINSGKMPWGEPITGGRHKKRQASKKNRRREGWFKSGQGW